MTTEEKLPAIRKSIRGCVDILRSTPAKDITQQDIDRVLQQLNFSLTNLQTDPVVGGEGQQAIELK